MTHPGIRHEVVDQIIDALGRATDAERAGEPWEHLRQDAHDLLGSATPEEILAVMSVIQAEADSHRKFLTAYRNDPASVAEEAALIELTGDPDSGVGAYAGLPDDAPEMVYLQMSWPWSPEDHALAIRRSKHWSPEQLRLLEERFGRSCPDGVHWE
jgi:hypothetical protein